VREAADETLVRAGGLALGPPVEKITDCRRPWPGDSGVVPAGGVRVTAADGRLTLRARRFGETWFRVGVLALPPGTSADLRPLRDASGHAYDLQAGDAARVCRLDG
jgi:hypothetical protein